MKQVACRDYAVLNPTPVAACRADVADCQSQLRPAVKSVSVTMRLKWVMKS